MILRLKICYNPAEDTRVTLLVCLYHQAVAFHFLKFFVIAFFIYRFKIFLSRAIVLLASYFIL